MESDKKGPEPDWYVLRDLKRPNSKKPAYKELQESPYDLQDKVFVPLVQRVYTRGSKKVVMYVPFMTDLLFVHEERQVLDPIVQSINTLQYRYAKGCKQHDPMRVSHAEMSRFIEAVRKAEHVEYYSLEEVSPQLYGKRIRIIGGLLNGYEGRLLSKRGSKHKSLLIDLIGVMSAAIQVESEYIQLIEE